MKIILCSIAFILLRTANLWAETKPVIDVFPPTGYDQATIYLNLGMFWAGIIGLVILLRLKLCELERVQKMEREEARKAAPLLE
jgi:hypothetical protein